MSDLLVVAVAKGRERYVWIYDDQHKTEFCRSVGMFASNPDLDFNWHDADQLSKAIKAREHSEFISVRIAQ